MKKLTIIFFICFLLSLNSCISPTESETNNLELLWKTYLKDRASAGIISESNNIFFQTDTKLYKLDKTTLELSSFSESGGTLFGLPAIDNNTIYTSSGGLVEAFDKETLSRKWYQAGFAWIPMIAVDEIRLYGTAENTTFALDKETGSVIWQNNDIVGKSAFNCKVDGERLYFATGGIHREDGYLYCLNKNTGEIIFQNTLPYMESRSQFGGSTTGVEIWGEYIFIPSDNRNIYCFNKTDGSLVWEFLADSPMETPSIVSEGILYTGSLNRTCYAIDASTGELIWSFQTVGSIRRIVPQFFKNYVMFISGAILIFDKYSGKLIADVSQKTGEDYGYFTALWDTDGKIYCTGYEESTQKWVFLIHKL